MTWFDHSRRAATVLLVVLALIAVPAVSIAKFTGSRTASLKVGTTSMQTPTAVSGTWACVPGIFNEGFDVEITGFTDTGPSGATYVYSLTRGTTPADSVTTTAKTVSLSGSLRSDFTASEWTVSIQPTFRSWTGTPYTKTIRCGLFSNATGSL